MTPTSSGVLNSELVCAGGANIYSLAPASTSPLVIERRASLVCFTQPPLLTYILPI
jgi:hypothetical protein